MNKNLIKIFYLPPPNITGKLHIGHVLNFVLTDIIIKNNKIFGYKTLWIPGLDHAGIATQIIIEKFLKNYGVRKTKKNFFFIFFKKWKKKYSKIITKQIKKFNISLNWKFKYFTLNSLISKLVKKIFIRLYKKKIINKKKFLINWDSVIKSNLSDIEIKKKYKKKYNLKINFSFLNKKGFLIINKNINNFIEKIKKKNIKLLKKKIILNYLNIKFPILFNNNLYKKKHYYIKKNLIFFFLILKKKNNIYLKKKYFIIKRSKKTNSLIKLKKKFQWFLLVKKKNKNINNKKSLSIKKILIKSLKKIKIIPIKWKLNYKNWIFKIKNWCISRQIWIGHKIPIFYKKKNIFIINKFKEKLIKKKYNFLKKEKNVLDTWFSSALIPIISKKIINNNFKFKKFIKSEIIISGYDIIFFWIIRMIIFSLYFLKKIPFKYIYIHGLIVDKKNNKMSKSKGNIINPIDLINNKFFNIDILRFLVSGLNSRRKNIKFDKNNKDYFFFINKIINLTNFIINNCNNYINFNLIENINNNKKKNSIINKWIISIIEENKLIIYNNLNKIKLNINNNILYKLIKNLYCSNYIEILKKDLKINSLNKKYMNCKYLLFSYYEIIKLIYPIIPNIGKKILKIIFNLLKDYDIKNNKKKNFELKINLINSNIKLTIIKYFFLIKKIKKKNTIIIYSKNFKILNIKKYINIKKKIIINKNYLI